MCTRGSFSALDLTRFNLFSFVIIAFYVTKVVFSHSFRSSGFEAFVCVLVFPTYRLPFSVVSRRIGLYRLLVSMHSVLYLR